MRATTLMTAAAVGIVAPLCQAGDGSTWVEVDDAGSLVDTAQTPFGIGPITQISGTTGVGDEQDLYVIDIVDVDAFSAVTGIGSYDTQLWLFDTDGHLVTGNDDDPTSESPFGSALFAGPNDDGTGGLTQAGTYILAVSGFGTPGDGGPGDPTTAGGDPLSSQETFGEHTGPDGLGGGGVLGGWLPGADTGSYTIELSGANFVPAPGALALLGLAGFAATRRRKA